MTEYVVPKSGLYAITSGAPWVPSPMSAPEPGEILANMRDALERIKGMRRTVFCDPALVDDVQAAVDREGMTEHITVQGSEFLPDPRQILIMQLPQPYATGGFIQGSVST